MGKGLILLTVEKKEKQSELIPVLKILSAAHLHHPTQRRWMEDGALLAGKKCPFW